MRITGHSLGHSSLRPPADVGAITPLPGTLDRLRCYLSVRLLPFLALALLAPHVQAAEGPAAKPAPKAGRVGAALPTSVTDVTDEQLTKIRRALVLTYADPALGVARKRLEELKERSRFANGRNEAEDLRKDFEKARDEMVKATLEAVLNLDPTIEKDPLVLTLNAIEEATKQRGQETARRMREQAAAEERLAKKDAPAAPTSAPEVKPEATKPMTPAELLADVDGVSAEDMRTFRLAALRAQTDPTVKALKAKQGEMRNEAEFASDDQKKNMRGEFETLQADMRKAQLEAVTKAAPGLSKETLAKIMETVEMRAQEDLRTKAKKKSTKTPLKPFPFGEKK